MIVILRRAEQFQAGEESAIISLVPPFFTRIVILSRDCLDPDPAPPVAGIGRIPSLTPSSVDGTGRTSCSLLRSLGTTGSLGSQSLDRDWAGGWIEAEVSGCGLDGGWISGWTSRVARSPPSFEWVAGSPRPKCTRIVHFDPWSSSPQDSWARLATAKQIAFHIKSNGQELPDHENGRPKTQIAVRAGIKCGYTVLNFSNDISEIRVFHTFSLCTRIHWHARILTFSFSGVREKYTPPFYLPESRYFSRVIQCSVEVPKKTTPRSCRCDRRLLSMQQNVLWRVCSSLKTGFNILLSSS